MRHLAFTLLLLSSLAGSGRAADRLELRAGERVLWIGGTLIEREQRYGYWETALTAQFPTRQIVFRNLGWSGDTVWSESRGVFDPPQRGYERLLAGVRGLKPTVIVIAYGAVEAHDGEAGLPRFLQGLNRLLDDVASTGARIVLASPLKAETPNPPLPDPAAYNRKVALYREAIREVSVKRKAFFLDLQTTLDPKKRQSAPWTDNGFHLTEEGYWRSTASVLAAHGYAVQPWVLELSDRGQLTGLGVKVEAVPGKKLQFRVTAERLPFCPEPLVGEHHHSDDQGAQMLHIRSLPRGKYQLKIDGKPVATASSADWAKGQPLLDGPDVAQAEKLRQVIVEKNRLYFHRWRPQNETYLYLFRKHEQGQNAREIPLFDPLVEEQEKLIAQLRQPVPHTYELVRLPD